MSSKITIVEVGPRDGLQNEKEIVPAETKIELIKKLSTTGLKRIEVGAFVAAKWIPQMADSNRVATEIISGQENSPEFKKIKYSALVPNSHGMDAALISGLKEVAVFTGTSESFVMKNINCSIQESYERFTEVIQSARRKNIRVRGYLSTCFGCPYEGKIPVKKVVSMTEKLLKMGIFEVSVSDTIGVATPKQVKEVLKALSENVDVKKLALHFHDTRGTALANIATGLEMGIEVFDSSLGGLGGCPYAKGAAGNVATEDVVYFLHRMGVKTGIDLQRLININHWMGRQLSRTLPSRVSQAGNWEPKPLAKP